MVRLTPWTPILKFFVMLRNIDASSCPVASLKIEVYGKITSAAVSRNRDRQLYAARIEIGPFS